MTDSVSSDCATCHTDRDGWIAIRDNAGHLWCEYDPVRQVIRHYRHANSKEGYEVEIAIGDLISGKYQPKTKRIPRK